MSDEKLDRELLACGITPEMAAAGVSRLKAAVGVPDWCRDMRHGLTKNCTCPAHTEHIRVGTAEAFDGGLDIVAPLPHERLNR